MRLSALAGTLCHDPAFRAWLESLAGMPVSVDDAAEFVRIACGIDSRRQLDVDPLAADLFHQTVRLPYLAWRDQQQPQRRTA